MKLPVTVRLSEAVNSLIEVKISSKKPVKISLGDLKLSHSEHWHPQPNMEFAQYIPNNNNITGTIVSVEYIVNDALDGIEMPFKVGLFTKSKDSIFPDKELIEDSIIFYNPKRKRFISIDISKYNIQVPEDGFFVVFETLSPSYYSKKLIWFSSPYIKTYTERVPGIDFINKDKNGPTTIFDYNIKKGEKYSLQRIKKDQWILFNLRSSFAMGATVMGY